MSISNLITRTENLETNILTFSFYGEAIWNYYIHMFIEEKKTRSLIECYQDAVRDKSEKRKQACDMLLASDRYYEKIKWGVECFVKQVPVVIEVNKDLEKPNPHYDKYSPYETEEHYWVNEYNTAFRNWRHYYGMDD